LVAEYHRGQLTQREFAGQHGLGLTPLARWLRQERDGPVPRLRQRPAFAWTHLQLYLRPLLG